MLKWKPIILCDVCGVHYGTATQYDTVAEQRRYLRLTGWVNINSHDWCPQHRPA